MEKKELISKLRDIQYALEDIHEIIDSLPVFNSEATLWEVEDIADRLEDNIQKLSGLVYKEQVNLEDIIKELDIENQEDLDG